MDYSPLSTGELYLQWNPKYLSLNHSTLGSFEIFLFLVLELRQLHVLNSLLAGFIVVLSSWNDRTQVMLMIYTSLHVFLWKGRM